jgi:hypothetical protein
MQSDLAVLEAVAEAVEREAVAERGGAWRPHNNATHTRSGSQRSVLGEFGLPSSGEKSSRASFQALITSKPEDLPEKSPVDAIRSEMGLAMNHLYTCESLLHSLVNKNGGAAADPVGSLEVQIETKELEIGKHLSEMQELRKVLNEIKFSSIEELSERSTANLKNYREW